MRHMILLLLIVTCAFLCFLVGCGGREPVNRAPESLGRLKAVSTETTAKWAMGGLPEKAEPVTCLPLYALGLFCAYRLPVCYEWSYVNANGKPESCTSGLKFTIEEGQPFQKAVDDFIANSGGRMELLCLSGMPCLAPSKPEATASALNDIVSLHVDNVTTFEAIKALLDTANADRSRSRVGSLDLGYWAGSRPVDPPGAFYKAKGVTVHVDNVTVRETLCAIMAVSPQEWGFKYTNMTMETLQPPLAGHLEIYFFKDNGVPTCGPLSTLESMQEAKRLYRISTPYTRASEEEDRKRAEERREREKKQAEAISKPPVQ